jgi:hypothetical protein
MAKYKYEALGVLHEMMKGIHEAGGISDERMREYDELCLAKPPAAPIPRAPAQRPPGAARSGASFLWAANSRRAAKRSLRKRGFFYFYSGQLIAFPF